MKKLIIVESPNKIKKLKSFLTDEYTVMASVGHVRDLMSKGKFQLGIDWETVTPYYKIMKDKMDIVEALKKEAEKSDEIYLAMDPDREGESISFHLLKALELEDNEIKRITFNEISEEAVLKAINNPRKIDYELVHAQESRRVLDRVVGFRLSKIVQKKVKARSAGRVQSAVLKIIIDREIERKNFIPDIWWTLEAEYKKDHNFHYTDSTGKILKLDNEKELNKILESVGEKFTIESYKEGSRLIPRPVPLEMSTYLSGMFSHFGMSNSQASLAIQKLYEYGHSSYPRTDSTRISSKEFLNKAEKLIKKEYGEKSFIPLDSYVSKKKRKKTEQDAHEAIRPTKITVKPSDLKGKINPAEWKAYSFIWKTTMQSMMENGKNKNRKYILNNHNYKFSFSTSTVDYQGFRVLNDDTKEQKINHEIYKSFFKLFNDKKLIKISKDKIEVIENKTKPQSRYTQASLIKKMKEVGIGRPSTYSPTTKLLFDRQYVVSESSSIIPTELGELVSRKLQEKFSDIINNEYTSKVENTFDEIAHGTIDYKKFLKDFYKSFEKRVEDALETMEIEIIPPKLTGEKCPKCGSDMIEKYSPVTKKNFEACSTYPECKYIKGSENKKDPIKLEEKCLHCSKKLLIRFHEQRGPFKACSNFPRCRKYGAKALEDKDIKFLEEMTLKDQSIKKELDKYHDNIAKRKAQSILRETKMYVPKEMKDLSTTELEAIIETNQINVKSTLKKIEQKQKIKDERMKTNK